MHSQARSYSKQHKKRISAAQTNSADEYHSHSVKKLMNKESSAVSHSKLSSQIKLLQEKHKLIDV